MVDNKITGPKNSTSLVKGYHYFDSSARNTLNNIQKLGDNRVFIGGSNIISFDGLMSMGDIIDTINQNPQGTEPAKFYLYYHDGQFTLAMPPEANASTVHQIFSDDIELVKIDQLGRTGVDLDYRYIADDPMCIEYQVKPHIDQKRTLDHINKR
jgi:hypothetical protein